MIDIHVQVEICMADGDTFSEIEICTPIHTSQERLCTVLSYYDHRHYILPRNVYVQFSLITIIANTSFPVTFMYRSLLFDYGLSESESCRLPDLAIRGDAMVSRGVAIRIFLKFSIDFSKL